ncbi:hypothetical protein HGP28_18700 [Vibrio sp. SM6]|uniref:Tyr recombinase domain-containing protein n=1 Tax=Vibrio agarilyticus TaxID=2726741 RepID=A0A7X8YIS5_9VIBR|nr:hypothetical protein [Vibrio agarilyticus]NLS14891.1 hypothetical protein [Vibrio agarilyticus]
MERTTSIFHAKTDREISEAFILITDVIKGVTGDETLRFHHCRHSFCNWVICQLFQLKKTVQWPFLSHSYFCVDAAKTLRERLGLKTNTRKQFWAISELLGHASPSTTLTSYFHLTDVFHRSYFANHLPELFAIRKIWGRGITLDEIGNPTLRSAQKVALEAILPIEQHVEFLSDTFDVSELDPPVVQPTDESIDVITVWRIIRRAAEGQTSSTIANDLSLSLASVKNVLALEKTTRKQTQRLSKHPARAMVNYHAQHRPNMKELEQWILTFHRQESTIRQTLNLTLLLKFIDTFVGAKDAKIRTHDKDVVLTLLKMLQILNLTDYLIEVHWYMSTNPVTSHHSLNGYLRHIAFWKKVLITELGMDWRRFTIILPQCHKSLKAHFVAKAPTRISDDGRFLKYKSPGTISISVKKTRFESDAKKTNKPDENGLKSRPRRRKSFVSFLRLLVIYLKVSEYHSHV